MKAFALTAMLIGCGGAPLPSGDDTPPPPQNDADPACTPATTADVAGQITADTTWTGTINLTAAASIAQGVTVTVTPGTRILAATDAKIGVAGRFDIQGSRACPVSARASAATAWGGITVATGGALTAQYLDQTGGNIVLQGAATITDSRLSNVSHDLIVMAGGTLDISYSWIGVELGEPDTTHCDLHFGGTGPLSVKVTHTNLSTAVFALMLYNGQSLDLTANNWFGNNKDIDTTPATPATADVSFGWFEQGMPSNPGLTATSLAAARLTDAGPR